MKQNWIIYGFLILIFTACASQKNENSMAEEMQDSAPVMLAEKPSLRWEFSAEKGIYSSATMSENILYFGSRDGNLYALDKNSGEKMWSFKTKGAVDSSPEIVDNQVYFTSHDGNLYALNKKTGKKIWQFQTEGEKRNDPWDYFLSSPKIQDETLFFGSGDSYVYALNLKDGSLKWKFKTDGITHTSPILDKTKIYMGTFGGTYYALDIETGKEIWTFKTRQNIGTPSFQREGLLENGTLYISSRDTYLYALDAKTGQKKWDNQAKNGSWVIATPTIYDDKLFYGTSDSFCFHAKNPKTGEKIWEEPFNMRIYGTAQIDKFSKTVIFGCFNGRIYGLDLETGQTKWLFQTKDSKLNYDKIYSEADTFRIPIYSENWFTADKQEVIHQLGGIAGTILLDENVFYVGDISGNFYAVEF